MSDQLQSQGPRSGGFLHFLHYKASKDWCVSNRSAPARHESVSLRLLLVGYSSFSGGQHVVEGVFANTCPGSRKQYQAPTTISTFRDTKTKLLENICKICS